MHSVLSLLILGGALQGDLIPIPSQPLRLPRDMSCVQADYRYPPVRPRHVDVHNEWPPLPLRLQGSMEVGLTR